MEKNNRKLKRMEIFAQDPKSFLKIENPISITFSNVEITEEVLEKIKLNNSLTSITINSSNLETIEIKNEKLFFLNLFNNNIKDINQLKETIKHLKSLTLSNNKIEDFSVLNQKNDLITLVVNNNKGYFEIEPENFENLRCLNISNTKINEKIISNIKKIHKLFSLGLFGYLSFDDFIYFKTKINKFEYFSRNLHFNKFYNEISYFYQKKKISEVVFIKLFKKLNN